MIFEGLAEKLQGTLKKLKGKGALSEKDVIDALREVRLALLEADVNFKVVKQFVSDVKERAIGQEVLTSLTPGQQVIKIVNEELTKLMGGTQSKVAIASKPPTIIMMVGLQGSGKTTTAGKLGNYFRKQNHQPLLVACDIYRPAAVQQIETLGRQLDIPVYSKGAEMNPIDISVEALDYAVSHNLDIVIIDTAGRLHIDEELMEELLSIKNAINPHEILLVVDAMTGQDAVNVAETFNEKIGINGIILTKLDGDTRGGAALSAKFVTGKPIKFVGIGEKMDALEPFYPDRMASRILGMGDILSFIEKAQSAFDAEKAKKLEDKIKQDSFDLNDFLEQMEQMKKVGPLDQFLEMMPGLSGAKQLKDLKVDEKQLKRIEAIIRSMTLEERANPHIINGSRRKRIAAGSGTRIQDVNQLLKSFEQMRKMMKQFGILSKSSKKKKNLFKFLQ